jgi:hypothetical protein
MAIILAADLAVYMNKTFTQSEEDAAALIISSIEGELSAIINRPLAPVQITDEIHMLQSGQRQIFLRKAPVTSVTSFSIGYQDVYAAQNLLDFDIHPWGIDNILIVGQGYKAKVTYNAGLSDSVASALERVCLSSASREMGKVLTDAQGLTRLKVEGTEYFFDDGDSGIFSKTELKTIERFKRRVIG